MQKLDKKSLYLMFLNEDNNFESISNLDGEDRIITLKKFVNRTNFVVEILDLDDMTYSELINDLKRSRDRIYNVSSRDAVHLFRIYLTKKQPFDAQIKAITDIQFVNSAISRYLSCYIVNTQEKKTAKLFEPYIKSEIVDNVLTVFLSKKNNMSDYSDDTEKISRIVKQNKIRQNENRIQFYVRTPYFSYILIAINLIVFFVIKGYSVSSVEGIDMYYRLLYKYGSKVNKLIAEGEFHRLITPMFLHGGLTHVAINCYSLYVLSIVENIFGHKKFLTIYFLAGIFGTLASFAFNISDSVGASGAIFGMFGALLYYGVEKPTQFKRYFRQGIILTLIINISFGLSNSSIDNYGHAGGLIGGLLVAGFVKVDMKKYNIVSRLPYIFVSIILFVFLFRYGIYSN